MDNQTRFIGTGLIIAISLGLVIELMKSARGSDSNSSRLRIFGIAENDESGNPNRSERAERARSRLLRARVAGLEANPALNQIPTAQPAANAESSSSPTQANLGNPVKINVDDAKKKEDAAKKKKKKKKKPEKIQPVAPEMPQEPASQDDSKSKSSGLGPASRMAPLAISQTILAGPKKEELPKEPKTLEEWLTYILPEPVFERTLKFTEAYARHEIDSEIFYEVIAQMLADSRLDMHRNAVYSLGNSKTSLKGFVLLTLANSMQTENSDLKIESRNYLKNYAKVENLGYLLHAISSGTEAIVSYEALRLIQVAATNYKPKAPRTADAPTTSSVSASISKRFQPFVAALNRLVQTSTTDSTLRQEASVALRQVQALIGTNPSGSNPPANPATSPVTTTPPNLPPAA